MKEGAMLRKNYELILFGIIFLSVLVGFVLAEGAANNHRVMTTSGATSWVVKEDQQFIFNFTINNSFADNVTRVNVTIPSTFAYKYLSNGSNTLNIGGTAFANFTNTTTLLSWQANTSLVLPTANSSFWFNATPSEPGTYTLTVNTANSTGSFINVTNLTVTVMEIHNVMTTTGARNFSVINEDTPAIFNITFNNTLDKNTGNITNITITFPSSFIFTVDSNGNTLGIGINATFTNTSTSLTWINKNSTYGGLVTVTNNASFWFNLTAQEPGTYNFTVTTINNQDNGTHVQNFTVTILDITDPVPTYTCTKARVSEGEYLSCSCNATDNYDPSPTLSYTSEPVTTNAGTYTVTCTATDDATYNGTASVTYIVETSSGNVVSGTSGGTTYTMTYAEDTKEFSEIKEVSKELGAKSRIRIKINNIKHEVGVKELTLSTATIETSSTPQTTTMNIGDIKKFDVTNDGYYDLSVTLNKIANSKADITLKSIYEKVTTETTAQEQGEEQAAAAQTQPKTATMSETKSNTIIWIIAIIIVVLILVGIGYGIKKKKRR